MTSTFLLRYPNGCKDATSVHPSKQTASTLKNRAIPVQKSAQLNSTSRIRKFVTDQTEQAKEEEKTWGDDIQGNPPEHNHRIYFQNLDGMKNDSDEIDLYTSTMKQLNVDTICWADPGLDFEQSPIRKKVQTIFQNHFKHVKIAFSSCQLPQISDHRGNGYQPGGTITATTGTWTTRSNGVSLIDPSGMGRWSGITLLGKNKKAISIITAYRSPRQCATGGFGFYDQQYSMLLSQGTKSPNVRKQFITDLTLFIQVLQEKGHHIVLALDANEVLNQEKHFGISSLMEDCQLHDLHSLGPLSPPATYKYGLNRRIDFILGSSKVREAVCGAGFNAYDNGIDSKHRGIFIDLKMNELMEKVPKIVPPAARRLCSEDPEHVELYLSHLKKYILSHAIRSRITLLQSQAAELSPLQVKERFDSIDRDLTRGMLHAEQKSKKPRGKYQWSPKLRAQGLITRYWRLRVRILFLPHCQRLKNQLSLIKDRLASLSILYEDDNSQESDIVKARWKQSLRELRKVRIIAYDYRQVHLKATLTVYEEQLSQTSDLGASESRSLETKIKSLKQLIQIEFLRGPFRALRKSVMKCSSYNGISKLLIPKSSRNQKIRARFCLPDGSITAVQLLKMAQFDKHSVNYTTILDPKEIERELLAYNHEWFRQAASTPFGHGPLYDYVGFDSLTPGGDFINEGYHPSYSGLLLTPEIEALMLELKRPKALQDIDLLISSEQFKQGIKKWKETTSTSPSGRHLGHYKAAITDNDLLAIHKDMINLPISHGFAPDRWCVSVSPLIEKDEGLPFIQRLRVIHLFEADYNLFLKIIFGKRMVAQAEQNCLLNDQQHGSRPRRTTMDALFLSRLSKDMLRQTRTNSIHMDNDATGCYDRIIISIGMLACRRLGVPSSAIKCQADSLRFMKYSIKHAYGISKESYSGTASAPLFGTGQGSGASPAIWLAIAVALLNAFDRISSLANIPGLSFNDPWNEVLEKWRVGAFVDDTNQGISDTTHSLSPSQLIDNLTFSAQLWERLLSASGGALNLSKCVWSIQVWQWKNGRPQLNAFKNSDSLLLTSGDSPEHHLIKQIPNEQAIKSLGVWINATGTFETQAKEMAKKFDQMASCLQSSDIAPSLASIFYHSYFLPSVKYPLPVTTMTKQQLQRIQSKFVSVTLTKMGFNRHYPRAVVFASKSRSGCGLHDLTVEQGLAQVQSILDYVGSGHKVGKVMIMSLRILQVEAGVAFDLLECPRQTLKYLTPCWMTSLRTFCATHEITLKLQENRIPAPSRVFDRSLMELAISLPFRRQELIDINLVRMHLQVTFTSDISSACGNFLHPFSWRGYSIPDRAAAYSYPRQPAPTPSQKALWRKLLRHLLHPNASSSDLRLLIPLGVWTAPSTQIWGAMVWKNTLYRCNPFSSKDGSRSISVHFQKVLSTASTVKYYDSTPDWYSATIPRLASPSDLSGSLIFFATFSEVEYPSILKPAKHFTHWCDSLGKAEARLLKNVFFNHCSSEHLLVQYLQVPCTLFIGTDGGKKRTRGSFAWIICGPDQKCLISNFGPVDGWRCCLSSLRSEATAIASVTLYLAELALFNDVSIQCKLQFYVDSTSAIANVKQLQDQIPTRKYSNNCDIFSLIKRESLTLRHYQLHHVHSHQKISFDQLPFPAKLNTRCDQMATHQMEMQTKGVAEELSSETPSISTSTPIILSHRKVNITSKYVLNLRHRIANVRHQTYLMEKFGWTCKTFDSIAWESIEQSMRKACDKNRATRSKLAHNWLNLGDQRSQYSNKAAHSDECPMCNLSENFRHLLTCSSPRAKAHRYHALNSLRSSLKSVRNVGALLADIISLWTQLPEGNSSDILDIIKSSGVNAIDTHICDVEEIFDQQSAIGWENLFRGYISTRWGILFAALDDPDSTLDQSTLLLSKCVRSLQDFSISIWTFRCSVLHENETISGTIFNAELHQDITRLYQVKENFSDVIQFYFQKPLEERLKDSTRQKQRWLALARLASSHSTAAGTRQQVLTTYFPPSSDVTVLVSPCLTKNSDLPSGLSDPPTVRRPTLSNQQTLTQTNIRDFCTSHL